MVNRIAGRAITASRAEGKPIQLWNRLRGLGHRGLALGEGRAPIVIAGEPGAVKARRFTGS